LNRVYHLMGITMPSWGDFEDPRAKTLERFGNVSHPALSPDGPSRQTDRLR